MVVWGALATGAQATEFPPCDPESPSARTVKSLPPQLAWDTQIETELEFNSAPGDPVIPVGYDALASFEAADPEVPITQPFSNRSDPPNVVFRKGDGAGIVTWTWPEGPDYFGEPTCERSVAQTVTTFRGLMPTMRIRGSRRRQVHFRPTELCQDFWTAAVGRVAIAVHGAGGKKSLAKIDQCGGGWTGRRARARQWALVRDERTVAFEPKMTEEGTFKFRYRAAVAGFVIDRGRFTFRTDITRPERVWEGTKRYTRFCIDRNRKIRSAGGRSYCLTRTIVRHRLVRLQR